MRRGHASMRMWGFTLMETLVSIAILVLLAGLVYAGLAPARERAYDVHCLNNFRQISKAVQMYREDYGGGEPPGALTHAQLGLPAYARLLLPYLGGNWSVLQCPIEDWEKATGSPPGGVGDRRHRVSYSWYIRPDELPWPQGVPKFSQQVAKRGNDTPLATDIHHKMRGRGGGAKTEKFIILRLSGQAQIAFVPSDAASWNR